ncbi:MAG: MFS transporter [Candidatus Ranarchaeia archaeon]
MANQKKGMNLNLLLFITVSHFFDHIYNNILSPLFPLIRTEIAITNFDISLLALISSFFLFLFQAPFGGLSDRIGPKYLIVFSLIFDGIAMITTSFAASFFLLFIGQLFFGIGISALHPPSFSALKTEFSTDNQGKVMAYFGVAANIGNSVAPVLAVVIASFLGSWRMSLIIISVFGIFWGSVVLLAFPNIKKEKIIKTKKKKTPLREKIPPLSIVALLLFINTSRGAVYKSVTQFTSLIFTDLFSYTVFQASLIFGLTSLVGAIFSIIGGVLADRTSRRFPVILGNIGAIICIILTAITPDPIFAVITFLGIGAGQFLGFSGIQAFTSDVTPEGNTGYSWGLLMGIQVLTRSLLLLPFGFIGDLFNLRYSLLFLACVSIIGTIPVIWVKSPEEKNSQVEQSNI